jgi:hypothetical protein
MALTQPRLGQKQSITSLRLWPTGAAACREPIERLCLLMRRKSSQTRAQLEVDVGLPASPERPSASPERTAVAQAIAIAKRPPLTFSDGQQGTVLNGLRKCAAIDSHLSAPMVRARRHCSACWPAFIRQCPAVLSSRGEWLPPDLVARRNIPSR